MCIPHCSNTFWQEDVFSCSNTHFQTKFSKTFKITALPNPLSEVNPIPKTNITLQQGIYPSIETVLCSSRPSQRPLRHHWTLAEDYRCLTRPRRCSCQFTVPENRNKNRDVSSEGVTQRETEKLTLEVTTRWEVRAGSCTAMGVRITAEHTMMLMSLLSVSHLVWEHWQCFTTH